MALYPDMHGNIYQVKAHGVTVEITDNWNAAFALTEDLKRKLGSSNASIHIIKDQRTWQQIAGKVD